MRRLRRCIGKLQLFGKEGMSETRAREMIQPREPERLNLRWVLDEVFAGCEEGSEQKVLVRYGGGTWEK